MANDISDRPWVLDTASASKIGPNRTWVAGATFRGYTTSGHKAIFKDSRGNTIMELVGNDSLTPVGEYWGDSSAQSVLGLALTTLDSGKVVVMIR